MSSVAMNTLRVPLLYQQTVDETTSEPVDVSAYPHVTIYVIGSGTTSSGVLTIETADFNPANETGYSGTWSPLDTVNASDVTGGAQKAVSFTPRALAFVRTRISTVIGGGGNVSTVLRAV